MRRAVCTLHTCRPCLLAQISVLRRPIRSPADWLPDCVRLFNTAPRRRENVDDRSRDAGPESDPSNDFGTLRRERKPNERFPTENENSKKNSKKKQNIRFSNFSEESFPNSIKAAPVPEAIFSPNEMEENDLFGTISDPDYQKLVAYEEGDDEELPKVIPYKQKPWWYLLHMKKLIKKKRLPDALEFFEVKMRVEDEVKPLRSVYDMLIAACGRAGYFKKAVFLFNDMKNRGYTPVDATYVGVFNACAECPSAFQEAALARAHKLREEMHQKGHIPNQIVYHSMIKAFGRRDDMVTAFQLADEMIVNNILFEDATFAFLLMACISDKESGLKHAIKIWRLLLATGGTPNLIHYNLLLKAIRECGLGDPSSAAKELLPPPRSPSPLPNMSVLHQLALEVHQKEDVEVGVVYLPSMRDADASQSVTSQVHAYLKDPKGQWGLTFERETRNRKKSDRNKVKNEISSDQFSSDVRSESVMNVLKEEDKKWRRTKEGRQKTWFEELSVGGNGTALVAVAPSVGVVVQGGGASSIPDLLMPLRRGQLSDVVSIRDAQNPVERLELFGGYLGILSRMHRDGVSPDGKFLTQLVETALPSRMSEADILKIASRLDIHLDTDFYNILIKKRIRRRDDEGALEAFRLIESKGLSPNEMTFGCMAGMCRTRTAAEELLMEMEKRELVPNVKIFGALCGHALSRRDLHYLLFVMSRMKRLNVAPDEKLLKKLEEFRVQMRKMIILKEKGGGASRLVDHAFFTEEFEKAWGMFSVQYGAWLSSMPAQVEVHPWTVFGYGKKWKSLEKIEKERSQAVAKGEVV